MGGRAWGCGRASGGEGGGGAPVEGVRRVAYRARRPPRRVELARAPRQRVHEDGVGVALDLRGGTHTWAQAGVRDGMSGSVVGAAVGTRTCGVTHGRAGGAMIICSRRSTIGASSDTWKDSRRCWNSATMLSYCSCACRRTGIGSQWRKGRTRTGATHSNRVLLVRLRQLRLEGQDPRRRRRRLRARTRAAVARAHREREAGAAGGGGEAEEAGARRARRGEERGVQREERERALRRDEQRGAQRERGGPRRAERGQHRARPAAQPRGAAELGVPRLRRGREARERRLRPLLLGELLQLGERHLLDARVRARHRPEERRALLRALVRALLRRRRRRRRPRVRRRRALDRRVLWRS